jgi:hypothetical protein
MSLHAPLDEDLWCKLPPDILKNVVVPHLFRTPLGFHLSRRVCHAWSKQSAQRRRLPFCISIESKDENTRRWWWINDRAFWLLGFGGRSHLRHLSRMDDRSISVIKQSSVISRKIQPLNVATPFTIQHEYIQQATYRMNITGHMKHLESLLSVYDTELTLAKEELSYTPVWWKFGVFANEQVPDEPDRRISRDTTKTAPYVPRSNSKATKIFQYYKQDLKDLTWEQFQMMDGLAEWKKWEDHHFGDISTNKNSYFPGGIRDGFSWTGGANNGRLLLFPSYNWYWFYREEREVADKDTGSMLVWLSDSDECFTATKRIFALYNKLNPKLL